MFLLKFIDIFACDPVRLFGFRTRLNFLIRTRLLGSRHNLTLTWPRNNLTLRRRYDLRRPMSHQTSTLLVLFWLSQNKPSKKKSHTIGSNSWIPFSLRTFVVDFTRYKTTRYKMSPTSIWALKLRFSVLCTIISMSQVCKLRHRKKVLENFRELISQFLICEFWSEVNQNMVNTKIVIKKIALYVLQ